MTEAAAAGSTACAGPVALRTREFRLFQRLMFEAAGVSLAASKKALVSGRLSRRVRMTGCGSFDAYHELLRHDPEERQRAIDLLTTNETYFFREPKHFAFMRETLLPAHPDNRPFRAWSAACSSGEETYSLAMLLDDTLGESGWELLGSDISQRVLERARRGLYPLARTDHMPPGYLKRYCLKGTSSYAGQFLVTRGLRNRVKFAQLNLNADLPRLEPFDVIFLRNVMIYFSHETKVQVVRRVLGRLRPGGHLFVGHSESVNGIADELRLVRPSVYRKPA